MNATRTLILGLTDILLFNSRRRCLLITIKVFFLMPNPRSYEQMKKLVTHHGFELNVPTRLGAGAIAGIVSVTVTYPLDLVRARLSVASATFTRVNPQESIASSSIPSPSSSTSSGISRSSTMSSTVSAARISRSLHTSVSQKMASTASTGEPLGVWSMTLKVMKEEGGFRALYRGLVPTALGVVRKFIL